MASADRIEAYAQAIFEIASAEGYLTDTEEELFRFARTFETNDELRRRSPTARSRSRCGSVDHRGPVRRHRALESTAAIVSLLVGVGRVSDLPEIVDRFVEIAARPALARGRRGPQRGAARRGAAAAPGDGALAGNRKAGRGEGHRRRERARRDRGRIGDTVIDGTVRRRLAQLKERI